MSKDQLPMSIVYVIDQDMNLVPDGFANKLKLEMFAKTLEKGSKIEVTYEVINGDGSYAQLAKLHACIRTIARETGHSNQEIKDLVKHQAGLYSDPGVLKSFANCSKEDLSSAIQACLDLGDSLSVNLHQF